MGRGIILTLPALLLAGIIYGLMKLFRVKNLPSVLELWVASIFVIPVALQFAIISLLAAR